MRVAAAAAVTAVYGPGAGSSGCWALTLLPLSGERFVSNSQSRQGFPQKEPVECYLFTRVRDLLWERARGYGG